MAKNIDPQLKKIGSYLNIESSSIFSIPEYQRAYSWEIKQCDKLWQDIELFRNSSGNDNGNSSVTDLDPYFFGTVILNCQDNDKTLSIIDGQQRTTTFIILCKALLLNVFKSIEKTKNDPESRRLTHALEKKRDELIKILYKVKDDGIWEVIEKFEASQIIEIEDISDILENKSINEQYKNELKKILLCPNFNITEQKVYRQANKRKDNRYTNFFRNFKFFYNKLDILTPSELNSFIECFLYQCEIIEIRSWNVEQAITMFNSLNSDGLPLLDSDIISAKLYSNSGDEQGDFNKEWSDLKEVISELELNKITNIDGILMQYMYIRRALDKNGNVITYSVRKYYTETNSYLLNDSLKLTAQLSKIASIWNKIKNYSIIKLMFKFNDFLKIYLICYLSRYEVGEISEGLVTRHLEDLLRIFVVLELVDLGYTSAKFSSFLINLNIKLVDKTYDSDEIRKDIERHINKEWNREEIEEAIRDYTKNSLVLLNEYLTCKENHKRFNIMDKFEIEHIMPRSGKNTEQIREDAGIQSLDEFKDLVNKIGNKIILEPNINRSIGNAWFRTKIKRSVQQREGYRDSKFASARELVNEFEDQENPTWTVKNIHDRTERIVERISNFIFGYKNNK